MNEHRHPKVFLSHAHQDSAQARKLVAALAEQGIDAWFESGLEVGSDWRAAMQERLVASDAVVVLIDRSFLASEWARRESEAALSRSWEKPTMPIIPVVEEGAAPPGPFAEFHRIEIPAAPEAPDWTAVANRIAHALSTGAKRDAGYLEEAARRRREALERMREQIAPLAAAEAHQHDK
jgi:TIR domain